MPKADNWDLNLVRWREFWGARIVGNEGEDVSAEIRLALSAITLLAVADRQREWADSWASALASDRRIFLSSQAVDIQASLTAKITLTGLPSEVPERDPQQALQMWVRYWGSTANAMRQARSQLSDEDTAEAMSPTVASMVLSTARLDWDWASAWSQALHGFCGFSEQDLDQLAEQVVTELSI